MKLKSFYVVAQSAKNILSKVLFSLMEKERERRDICPLIKVFQRGSRCLQTHSCIEQDITHRYRIMISRPQWSRKPQWSRGYPRRIDVSSGMRIIRMLKVIECFVLIGWYLTCLLKKIKLLHFKEQEHEDRVTLESHKFGGSTSTIFRGWDGMGWERVKEGWITKFFFSFPRFTRISWYSDLFISNVKSDTVRRRIALEGRVQCRSFPADIPLNVGDGSILAGANRFRRGGHDYSTETGVNPLRFTHPDTPITYP